MEISGQNRMLFPSEHGSLPFGRGEERTFMRNTIAVGIDLGTTNSAVAYISEAGRTVMLANDIGDAFTPSAVYFDDHEVIVGRDATKALVFEPERVAFRAKRDAGQQHYSQPIRGKLIPPEIVQACVLEYLKKTIDKTLAGDYGVVITVPAFFDERRRKSVEDAGRIAGLEVLNILNEPTAAALAYAEYHGYLSEDSKRHKEPLNILVYDLGGGTFDATVIRLQQGMATTLATDGDVRLGGDDWDLRLADYLAQKFEALHRCDPRDDPIAMNRLLRLAEESKQTLSARHKTTIQFEHEQRECQVDLTREQFEILTSDLLERTAHTARETLAAAGLSVDQLDRVVLAGGATRMPMVLQMLESTFQRVPDQTLNADEAVARGAAIYASHLLHKVGRETAALNCQVVDVNAHSLGIEGVDPVTHKKQNTILIPRNTPLPTSVLHKFVTKKPNQETISIKVLEGESLDPDACILIGKAVMRDLPPNLPKGTHVEVVYAYEANGRLSIALCIPGTDRRMRVELNRAGNLADDRIHAWQAALIRGGSFSDFVSAVEEALGVRVDESDR